MVDSSRRRKEADIIRREPGAGKGEAGWRSHAGRIFLQGSLFGCFLLPFKNAHNTFKNVREAEADKWIHPRPETGNTGLIRALIWKKSREEADGRDAEREK